MTPWCLIEVSDIAKDRAASIFKVEEEVKQAEKKVCLSLKVFRFLFGVC
jgi:hypothetical protein